MYPSENRRIQNCLGFTWNFLFWQYNMLINYVAEWLYLWSTYRALLQDNWEIHMVCKISGRLAKKQSRNVTVLVVGVQLIRERIRIRITKRSSYCNVSVWYSHYTIIQFIGFNFFILNFKNYKKDQVRFRRITVVERWLNSVKIEECLNWPTAVNVYRALKLDMGRRYKFWIPN